jgi:hypothetical protein
MKQVSEMNLKQQFVISIGHARVFYKNDKCCPGYYVTEKYILLRDKIGIISVTIHLFLNARNHALYTHIYREKYNLSHSPKV